MLNLRRTRRARTRKETRRIRSVIERLESRKLMAGDLDVGSYLIDTAGQVDNAPPAIEQTIEIAPVVVVAPVVTPVVPLANNPQTSASGSANGNVGGDAIANGKLPGSNIGAIATIATADAVDSALTGGQLWLTPDPLPSCLAVKLDNPADEMPAEDSHTAEASLTPSTPRIAVGNMGGIQTVRDKGNAGARGLSDLRGALPLNTMNAQPTHLLGLGDATGPATTGKSLAREFHYFTDDVDGRPTDGPSLVNHSLSDYAQSDSFMAMGLLPSPGYSQQDAETGLPDDAELRRHPEQPAHLESRVDDLDLNSIRQVVTMAQSSEIVVPRSFLAATTDSLSATVACAVSMDWFYGNTDSIADDDASLISKINRNRYHVAAFAFVFTVVTTRLNRSESEKDESEQDHKDSRI